MKPMFISHRKQQRDPVEDQVMKTAKNLQEKTPMKWDDAVKLSKLLNDPDTSSFLRLK